MSAPYQGQSNTPNIPAISGKNSAAGYGVYGESSGLDAVRGVSHSPQHAGVAGTNGSATGGAGVWGEGSKQGGEGVHGISHTNFAGVAGYNDSTGAGVFGKSTGGAAGFFEGNVVVQGNMVVTGDIALTNADCAEEFDIEANGNVEPGTVNGS